MQRSFYKYEIKPIEGREYLQRNFAALPQTASEYNDRRVTLSERFTIYEKGFLYPLKLKFTVLKL